MAEKTAFKIPTGGQMMKNEIKLAALGCLAGFSLWRAASHDDAMTMATAAITTVIFLLAAWHMWRMR